MTTERVERQKLWVKLVLTSPGCTLTAATVVLEAWSCGAKRTTSTTAVNSAPPLTASTRAQRSLRSCTSCSPQSASSSVFAWWSTLFWSRSRASTARCVKYKAPAPATTPVAIPDQPTQRSVFHEVSALGWGGGSGGSGGGLTKAGAGGGTTTTEAASGSAAATGGGGSPQNVDSFFAACSAASRY